MATITQTRPRHSGGSLLLLAILAAIAMIVLAGRVPTETVMPTMEHAVERHGSEALEVAALFTARTGNDCMSCMDGRTRCIRWVTGKGYALAVYDAGDLVTAFYVRDQAYIRGIMDMCHPVQQVPHDGHS